MDENNPPVMLPNNEVYSSKAILRMAEENDGIITCEKTGKSFSVE